MLVDIGVSWVILGHPDRRQMCGETVEDAAKKAEHAISSGLKVIGCIGETLQEHQQGKMLEVWPPKCRRFPLNVGR